MRGRNNNYISVYVLIFGERAEKMMIEGPLEVYLKCFGFLVDTFHNTKNP
jgi:hypothetical protein